MKFRLHSLLLLVPLLLSLGCEIFPSYLHVGQRLLNFEILLADKIQFTGFRGVNDNMPVPQMWDVLADITFEPVDKKSITNDPRQTTLSYQGNVVIRIKHVDEELDSISTETLTLSRSETTNDWSLNQKEIDRLKHLLNQR
jgi:hypothetical protein